MIGLLYGFDNMVMLGIISVKLCVLLDENYMLFI